MEKQKKSYGAIALVVLLLILTIVSLILATYAWAKYTTKTTGNATADVAKWDVTFTPNANTIESNSYVASGKIAPGSKGSFRINVDPGDTEVAFSFEGNIDSIQLLNGDTVLSGDTVLADNVTVNDVLGHIKLSYVAVNHGAAAPENPNTTSLNVLNSPEGDWFAYGVYGFETDAETGESIGNINSNNPTNDVVYDYIIYWEWPFENDTLLNNLSQAESALSSNTDDSQTATLTAAVNTAQAAVDNYNKIDTAAGKYAAGQTNNQDNELKLKINYTMEATQYNAN